MASSGPARFKESTRTAWCVLAAVLYVSIYFVPYLFTGASTLFPSYQDESQWLLYQLFINDAYSSGEFPLWTPHLFCGMPFLAWSHSASLYPLNVIFAALDYGQGVWVNQWVHAVLWSLGVFFLCRKLGASKWAALFAVLVSSGVFVREELANFLPNIRTASFAPWLFLAAYGLVVERRLLYVMGFILANLMMFLGGQIELVGLAYELMAVVLVAGGLYFRRQWRLVLRGYVLFAACFCLAYIASQVQAMPTLELTGLSIRGEGLTYEYFKIWSSMARNFRVWVPYLLTGAVLAPVAAAVVGARRSAVLLPAAVALLYCLSLIHDFPGVMWVLYHLPVVRGLLAHSRIVLLAYIVLALMIALGADAMINSPRRHQWLVAVAVSSVAAAGAWWLFAAFNHGLLAAAAEPTMQESHTRWLRALDAAVIAQALVGCSLLFSARLRQGAFPVVVLYLMALSCYFAPVMYSMPNNPAEGFDISPRYERFVKSRPGLHRVQSIYAWDRWERMDIPLQTGVLFGARSADGFITVSVDRYTRFLNAVIPGTFRERGGKIGDLEATKVFKEGAFITDGNIPWLNFMGIRYLFAQQRNIKFATRFFLAYPDSPFLAGDDKAGVERKGKGAKARDLLCFTGRASAHMFMQEKDSLSFEAHSTGAGLWHTAVTENKRGDKGLRFARLIHKAPYSSPGIRLAGEPGEGDLVVAAAANETCIAEPVIKNPDRYFQMLDLPHAEFRVFENPGAMPPAFLAEDAIKVEREEALEMIETRKLDPAGTVAVEGLAGLFRAGPRVKGEGVRIDGYAPGEVTLTARAAMKRVLALTDVYFPGWKAWVDGKQARILPTNYAFRGVALGPGLHRVRMAYQPISFKLGLWTTICSVFVLACAAAWSRSDKAS